MKWRRMSKNHIYNPFVLTPTIDMTRGGDRLWAECVLGKQVYEILACAHTPKVRVRVKSVNRTQRSILIEWVDDENPQLILPKKEEVDGNC